MDRLVSSQIAGTEEVLTGRRDPDMTPQLGFGVGMNHRMCSLGSQLAGLEMRMQADQMAAGEVKAG